jgi:hypothetical protein
MGTSGKHWYSQEYCIVKVESAFRLRGKEARNPKLPKTTPTSVQYLFPLSHHAFPQSTQPQYSRMLRTSTKIFRTLSTLKSPSHSLPIHHIRTMASSAMSKRLEGKTIVITGASSGIGRSTAVEFARTSPKNLRLILTARRIDTLKEVAAEIKKDVGDGVKVLPFQLDVSKPEQVRGFVGNLPEEWREIDVLVNNA